MAVKLYGHADQRQVPVHLGRRKSRFRAHTIETQGSREDQYRDESGLRRHAFATVRGITGAWLCTGRYTAARSSALEQVTQRTTQHGQAAVCEAKQPDPDHQLQ